MDLPPSVGKSDDSKPPAPREGPLCCCGPCARWVRRCLPAGCLGEIKELTKLAVPLMISQFLMFLISMVSTMFCGHLGKEELDAATIANAVMSTTGYSLGVGFASATDTHVSQTFGGNNLKQIGIIMQRALILLFLLCFPCWALFINTENILLLLKQDPLVSRLAGKYVLISSPVLLEVFIFQLQMSYLQNQGITMPQIFAGIFANIINIVLHYVFLFVLHLGIPGAAYAVICSRLALVVVLFLYIWVRKLHVTTWGGWSWECFQEWGPLSKLAIPSILTVCFEWWIYEIGTFLAGLISVTELAGQSIIYQIVVLFYMIPYSLGTAVGVRVGNALGAGDPEHAKRSTIISLLSTGVVFAIDIAIIGGARKGLARVFTSDQEIIELAAHALLVYSAFHLFESIACTANGILKGIGKQKIGAITYAIGYYVVGVPLMGSLMFVAKLGVIGLWAAMTICAAIPAISLTVYVLRVNWKNLTEEAQERAGLKQKTTGELAPSYTDSLSGEDTNSAIIIHEGLQNSTMSDQLPLQDMRSGSDEPKNKDFLPVKTLILRRGLAITAPVVLLIIGILVRLLVEHN
ncbi:multidrug and toxin extrusion protein 2-like [Ambystoma mexicanum]|uniref:multidrug and toxin extrusion protein 2-like n=1 Tax=Ambystoma mexicanum TaxID=8296 RepID=UPI0037E8C285